MRIVVVRVLFSDADAHTLPRGLERVCESCLVLSLPSNNVRIVTQCCATMWTLHTNALPHASCSSQDVECRVGCLQVQNEMQLSLRFQGGSLRHAQKHDEEYNLT